MFRSKLLLRVAVSVVIYAMFIAHNCVLYVYLVVCEGNQLIALLFSRRSYCRERLSEDFAVRQAPRRHMDKAYDHENSEVLLCKLRRASNKEGGRGDGREKPEGKEGKKGEASCAVEGRATGTMSTAGEGDEAEGCSRSAGGAKTLCSDKGDAVRNTRVEPAAAEAAAEAADGLSLTGVSLSPSLLSSAALESVDANGSSPNGGALLTTVKGGNPPR